MALAGHPRIGERPAGADRAAAWSREEQAQVVAGGALGELNAAYEQRFGHVFLIAASGRTGSDILAAARDRLANDGDTERRVVRDELWAITFRRLERLVA